ncbi:MAG: hypothetical protein R3198_16470 [Marinobacter sp.]|nr:hypothetical protein [Marinobacter sp.]
MARKPDIIRSIVLIFAVGLVITGFTSLQASQDEPRAIYSADGSEIGMVPAVRD